MIVIMKDYLFFFFLFIGSSVCIKNNDDFDSWLTKIQNNRASESDHIIRPCSTSDMRCIRKFFSMHSKCKPAYGPIPDPLVIDWMPFRTMYSNISSVLLNAGISGLNGEITSFYINKKTNNLVIAFEVKDITLSSPHITFVYTRKGKEPIKLTDAFFVTYSSATFTAVIPNIKNLQLDKAHSYAYLDDSNPNYGLGPGITKSTDPVVLKQFNHLICNMPDNGKESLVIQAPNIMKIFIQYKICDFGLKLTNT